MVRGEADDKRRARLNCIAHLLSQIPYENVARKRTRLPKRQKPSGYREPVRNYKYVPDAY
jgi:polyphosphate kinase